MNGDDPRSSRRVVAGVGTPLVVRVGKLGDAPDSLELPHGSVLAKQHDVLPPGDNLLYRTDLVHLWQDLRRERVPRVPQRPTGTSERGRLHLAPRDDIARGRQGMEGPASGGENGGRSGEADASRDGESTAIETVADRSGDAAVVVARKTQPAVPDGLQKAYCVSLAACIGRSCLCGP